MSLMQRRPFISSVLGGRLSGLYPNAATAYTLTLIQRENIYIYIYTEENRNNQVNEPKAAVQQTAALTLEISYSYITYDDQIHKSFNVFSHLEGEKKSLRN